MRQKLQNTEIQYREEAQGLGNFQVWDRENRFFGPRESHRFAMSPIINV